MVKQIVIAGSSGYVGSATIAALATAQYNSAVHVKAGVRNPSSEKAQVLAKDRDNVDLVELDISNDQQVLQKAFTGADAAFIVTPGHIDREKLAINAIDAAAAAGAKYILIVSVLTVGTDTIFGRQFVAVEQRVKDARVPYGIIRLPFFIDNLYASAPTVKSDGKLYGPAGANGSFTPVTVHDIAQVSASILADPEGHTNKTYTLVSSPVTYATIADTFSKVLGKTVEYVQVPYEAAKESFMSLGVPEWQADGIMELFRYFDASSEHTRVINDDIKLITGQDAQTVEAWVEQNKGAFV
jgi:uncharacterized protein YbjT (DUF2867 family)